MFKKKEKVVTFDKEGKEVLPDIPESVPELELPPIEEVKEEEKVTYEPCFICKDASYYVDKSGVWYPCPRCNKENFNGKLRGGY